MNILRLRENIRNGVDLRLLDWSSTLQGKSSPPPAPDYRGSAEAQGAANEEIARQQTYANRPTQITPWGQTTWGTAAGTDPATGAPVTQWTQNQTLTPELQGALESQIATQQARSQLGEGFTGRVQNEYAQPFDWSGLPQAPGSGEQAQQEAYNRMQQFQAPERQTAQQQLETRLANQGLTQGSEAYNTEMRRQADEFGRQDLQNLMSSFGEGRAQGGFQNQLRQQAIAEQAQRRGMSLNEMNALLTGQQVGMPQMPSFMGAQGYQAPNLLGAAQSQGQYGLGANAQDMQNQQNLWGGLGALGGMAGMMYGAGMFSDIRLKSNIVKVGWHPIGVAIYEYDLFGERQRGIMAQELIEVAPELVFIHPSGYMMVNYGGLQ